MGQQVDELLVKIKGDIKDLKAKMSKSQDIAKKTFTSIGKSVSKMSKPLKNAFGKFNNLTGAIGLTAGAAGLGALINSSLDSADALAKLSGQIGVSAEFLQEMRFAASQTGVAQNELDQSLRIFTKNIGQANDGVATYSDEFKKLGVDIKDSNGELKNSEVLFAEVADGLQALDSDTERASTAFTIFGRAGIKLVNTMKNGSEGLNKYQQEARDLGIVLEGDVLKNAEEANDKFDILSRVISTQVVSAVVELAPHLTELATDLIEASRGAVQFAKDVGLIEEKDPAKNVQNLSAELVDLEQKLMKLEEGRTSILSGARIVDQGAINHTKKKMAEIEKVIAESEAKIAEKSKGTEESKQATVTEIQNAGIQNRKQFKDEQAEKEQAEESKRVEEKIARLQEENQLLTEIDFAANEEKILANQEKLARLEENESLSAEASLKIKADRLKREREMDEAALGGLATTFGNIMSLTKGQNRELFELSKASATATAIVQGVLGVQRALGSAPPPLNFISAAAVGTSAAVNVAKIQGTSFNKGTDSVPGIGNFDTVPAVLTPGERVVPRETNKDLTSFLANGGGNQKMVTINVSNTFNGLSIDSDEAKLDIIESINSGVRELGAKVII